MHWMKHNLTKEKQKFVESFGHNNINQVLLVSFIAKHYSSYFIYIFHN